MISFKEGQFAITGRPESALINLSPQGALEPHVLFLGQGNHRARLAGQNIILGPSSAFLLLVQTSPERHTAFCVVPQVVFLPEISHRNLFPIVSAPPPQTIRLDQERR